MIILMQKAINLITELCLGQGLKINPIKTVIMPFTKTPKINLNMPALGALNILQKHKYLGVFLDQKVTQHVKFCSYLYLIWVRLHSNFPAIKFTLRRPKFSR